MRSSNNHSLRERKLFGPYEIGLKFNRSRHGNFYNEVIGSSLMMNPQQILRIAALLSLAVLPFASGCFSMTGALVGGTVGGGVGLVSGTVDGKPGEGLRNGFSDGMIAGMLVGGEVDMAILEPFDDWSDRERIR